MFQTNQITDNPGANHGIVYKKNKDRYEVRAHDRSVSCAISTRLWKEMNKKASAAAIAVGDYVRFTTDTNGQGTITDVLPRQNRLARQSARPMPGAHAFEHVIVANVDQVVPVFAAANPAPRWNLLDRYLVTAESLNLPALICITKLDLVQDKTGTIDAEILETLEAYRKIGYQSVMVSAVTGEGLDELQ